jgi:5-methylcytosine-specific restriction endonuclease McrA
MPTMPKRVHSIKEYNPRKTQQNWLKNQEDLKFYNTQAWRKLSLSYKMKHPVCEVDECTQPSYYTDHIVPVADGGDKWDTDNFQALCKSCNGSKTAKQIKR